MPGPRSLVECCTDKAFSLCREARTALQHEMVRDSLALTVSTLVLQGTKFVAYLYAAKMLGPTVYGLWNALLLILTYGGNTHMGVLNAMNREIPYFEGAGRPERVEEIRDLGAGVVSYTAFPLSILTFLAGFWPSLDSATATGMRMVALMLVVQQFTLYFQMLVRSHGLFLLQSKQQLLNSLFLAMLVLPATAYLGFMGFLAGQLLAMAGTLVYLKTRLPVQVRPTFDLRKVLELVRIGMPIMAIGLAYGMLTTIDRLMILKYLGKEQLGHYSLSIMATGLLTLLPMMVTQVVYPRMARQYGVSRSRQDLRRLTARPTSYLAAAMLPMLLIARYALPPLVEAYLPAYRAGIPALRITVWGVFFLSLVGCYASFMIVAGHQRLYLFIQAAAAAVLVLLNFASIHLQFGIEGIALATSMTYALYAALMIVTAVRLQSHDRNEGTAGS